MGSRGFGGRGRPVGECVTSASLDIGVGSNEESGKSVQLGQCPGVKMLDQGVAGDWAGSPGQGSKENRSGSGLSVA